MARSFINNSVDRIIEAKFGMNIIKMIDCYIRKNSLGRGRSFQYYTWQCNFQNKITKLNMFGTHTAMPHNR
jgi:hypothetical protein